MSFILDNAVLHNKLKSASFLFLCIGSFDDEKQNAIKMEMTFHARLGKKVNNSQRVASPMSVNSDIIAPLVTTNNLILSIASFLHDIPRHHASNMDFKERFLPFPFSLFAFVTSCLVQKSVFLKA